MSLHLLAAYPAEDKGFNTYLCVCQHETETLNAMTEHIEEHAQSAAMIADYFAPNADDDGNESSCNCGDRGCAILHA